VLTLQAAGGHHPRIALLVCWLVYPIVLVALLLGCGLLLELACGVSLPAPLLPAAGLATIGVVSGLTTLRAPTTPFTTPLVVALAVAGLGLSPRWWTRFDPRPVCAALATFLAYGATVLASGQATFAGYIKLDDTATFLALLDRVMHHGRTLGGLEPSTYQATLAFTLGAGYPVGALLPLGVSGQLVPSDNAWLFQPYLAVLAALLALCLYHLASLVIAARPLRVVAAFLAAQPALLYGYGLWGGVKELFGAALLPSVLAMAPLALRRGGIRAALVPGIGLAALFAGLTLGSILWLAPIPAAMLFAAARGRRRAAVGLAIAAVPLAIVAHDWFSKAGGGAVRADELGNLVRALNPLQVLGIWPSGDFRFRPHSWHATIVLLAVTACAAVLGALEMWRRRAWTALAYVALAAAGAVAFVLLASPWIAGKALAIAAPALLLAAVTGAAALVARGRGVEGALVLGAVAFGVLWSNALAYRGVDLAPRGQLAELDAIGKRFAGDGPTLMTEYEPYGVRHFLRRLDAEGASELRVRPVTLRSGGVLDKGAYADLDAFSLPAVLVYPTLVLRRSPVESRPPSPYQLAWSGRWYEVWRRADDAPQVLAHLPLGSAGQAGAPAPCPAVRRLAAVAARAGGVLEAVPRAPAVAVQGGTVTVPVPARYTAWLGGSFRGSAGLHIDGLTIAQARHQLNEDGQYTPLGEVRLARGTHAVALDLGGPDLHPGSGGPSIFPPPGPLVLTRDSDATTPLVVSPARASSLCGRRLDWVEAVS
jgi:hypothetical protein